MSSSVPFFMTRGAKRKDSPSMRKLLLSLVALITMLGGATAIVTVAPLSSVVRADDDDCDSSGPGSGNCDDNHGGGHDDNDDRSGHGGGDDDIDEDDVAAQTALAQPAGTNEIRIIDEQFVSNTITIQVGESVTFVNADDDEHTATGPGFDTGVMNPGDSVTITFDEAGTFDFVCQFHPEMRGTVIVEGNGTPAASPVASPVANAATVPAETAGATIEMDIVDFSFAQADLTVAPGTTITWTNAGVAPHTVSGLPEESGTLDPGQSFSFTFTDPGTFDYQCAFHPQMVGQVIVDPDAPPPGA
jgi:plastocyanin